MECGEEVRQCAVQAAWRASLLALLRCASPLLSLSLTHTSSLVHPCSMYTPLGVRYKARDIAWSALFLGQQISQVHITLEAGQTFYSHYDIKKELLQGEGGVGVWLAAWRLWGGGLC